MDLTTTVGLLFSWVGGHVSAPTVQKVMDKLLDRPNKENIVGGQSLPEFRELLQESFGKSVEPLADILKSIQESSKSTSEGVAVLVDRGRRV